MVAVNVKQWGQFLTKKPLFHQEIIISPYSKAMIPLA